MQTIFLATDKSGGTYGFPQKPQPAKDGAWCGCGWFSVPARYAPPPGECREYRLVPVCEADELERDLKDATEERDVHRQTVEQLVAKLNERSPGVMPAPIRELTDWAAREVEGDGYPASVVAAVRGLYETPGYEWQPVDAEHPITADDVGRKVAHRNGGISGPIDSFGKNGSHTATIGADGWDADGRYWTDSESGFDIVRILRPIAPKFVFDGTPGRYRTNNGEEVEIRMLNSRLVGVVVGSRTVSPDVPFYFKPDGTFPGGRIVGRVE